MASVARASGDQGSRVATGRQRRHDQAAHRRTVLNVLIVEDSARLRDSLERGLTAAGFGVDLAADGVLACHHLDTYSYELVVLDLGLPRKDGLAVLQHLHGRPERPRVLVLSARDLVTDRVGALNLGADDYLVKPFAFDELLARLHALARRPKEARALLLTLEGISLNPQARSVDVHGAALALTPREFALLELLMRHRGRVFARSDILDRLAGSDSGASDRSIEVLVFGLRRKLDQAGMSGLVETRRGAGYLIP
jgi:DNA-binding response OmpR family regulator